MAIKLKLKDVFNQKQLGELKYQKYHLEYIYIYIPPPI